MTIIAAIKREISDLGKCIQGNTSLNKFVHTVAHKFIVSEKEKEDRLRQSELVKARSVISDLERRILSLNTTLKQEKIEHEKEIERIRIKHEV